MKHLSLLFLFIVFVVSSNAQIIQIRNNKSCGVSVVAYGVDQNHTVCSRVYRYSVGVDMSPGSQVVISPSSFQGVLGAWVGIELSDCGSAQGFQPPCAIGYAI